MSLLALNIIIVQNGIFKTIRPFHLIFITVLFHPHVNNYEKKRIAKFFFLRSSNYISRRRRISNKWKKMIKKLMAIVAIDLLDFGLPSRSNVAYM